MFMHREKDTWGHREKVAICESKKEAPGETTLADTLILGFQPSELCKNKFLLVKLPNLWTMATVLEFPKKQNQQVCLSACLSINLL